MPLSDDDPFAPILNDFMNSNYDPLLAGPTRGDDPPSASYPLKFYDHHTASNLLLKSIKPAPWLPENLSAICDSSIEEYLRAGHTFNPHGFPFQTDFPENCIHADDVARIYHNFIGEQCAAFATKFLFTPDEPGWFPFMVYYTGFDADPFRARTVYESVDPEIDAEPGQSDPIIIPPSIRERLDDSVISTLTKLRQKDLAYCNFYVLTKQAEKLLLKMGPVKDFKWVMPRTKGLPPAPCRPTPADSSCLGILFPSMLDTRVTARMGKELPVKSDKSNRKIVPAPRVTKARQQRYRPDANHFIQEAWNKAVVNDTTFFIINCGRYERIGVRHRETQTLYLSDLIRPEHCANPSYAKMHLGLTIAIIKDAIDRFSRPTSNSDGKGKGKKRPSNDSTNAKGKGKASRKRRRTEGLQEKKLFDVALSERDLLLYSLDHRVYQSPAPSSFLRLQPSCAPKPFIDSELSYKRNAHHSTHECIAVTVPNEPMARGATGLIYRVSVSVELESGEKMHRDMIMKVVLLEDEEDLEAKERMVHEYEMYKILAAAGVTDGIVSVHGLFQDAETCALAILMDDGGETLRERIRKNPDYDSDHADEELISITENQQDAFVASLSAIHKAHISHEDLRIDNLLINENGQVYIIDFDRGIHDVDMPLRFYEEERHTLLDLIGWGTHTLDTP